MADERIPEVGKHIIFVDRKGKDCDALITAVWGPSCINVIIVSDDESRQDGYGRQTIHETSVPRMSETTPYGYHFRFTDEEKMPYTPPIAS